jgi:hypothetical protein
MMAAPPPWRYRCYVSIVRTGSAATRRDEVQAWYERQSKEWKRKFYGRLLALRGLPPEEWRPPLFRWLRGEGQGLGEIRFKADRVQQRPLGFRGPEPDIFTVVFPAAREKGSRFVPQNAIEQANQLKAEVKANKEHAIECWLFPDP